MIVIVDVHHEIIRRIKEENDDNKRAKETPSRRVLSSLNVSVAMKMFKM